MKIDLGDLNAFVTVARAKGFRDAARATGASASGMSEAVRRLEARSELGYSTGVPGVSPLPRPGNGCCNGSDQPWPRLGRRWTR